jgi:glucose-6-phosphate dehydrogenase assembly protein OpcA
VAADLSAVGAVGGVGGTVEPAIRPLAGPDLSWSAKATSVAEIVRALARIWTEAPPTAIGPDGEPHVVARTSVLNLVTVARRPELADRALATFTSLTGRHPSRSIVVVTVDPDGPRSLRADITAQCTLPRHGGTAMCFETVVVVAGGDAGAHIASIIPPLLIHDLPVALWWLGDVPFGRTDFEQLTGRALETDRLVVDGSAWSGDGTAGVGRLGAILDAMPIAVSDFALMRQSRWR